MQSLPRPPVVMTFSASDPTAGAGLQADLLACVSMGCHAVTVVTGVTVQDTAGVESVEAIDAELLEDQARLLLEDTVVDCFKVGLLCHVENIQAVAEIAADYPDTPMVLDPVLASGRGDNITNEDQRAALCELLLPQTTVLTPNSLEARQLAHQLLENAQVSMERAQQTLTEEAFSTLPLAVCAEAILASGCEYVLITGTHEPGQEVINTLYGPAGLVQEFRYQRLPASYHGSGCTLASALAALLAAGLAIPDAVKEAQEYTWQTLSHGFQLGMGQPIPDRLFWARQRPASHPAN
ncbi:hydroxymethylpyrimidine/phosphomethylpyrimidine kinase [Parvibium lacunae]|uniref:hydroxymethylpyrimidine kinase n=2 Tax=Parvibium lacunae TaxID=1888893 RepID=A0A368L5W0_9BURK|nr:hydroxymethylpyrimidine/phosphomethylpyrimidine kinase [Parvibium lacunae]